MAPLLAAVALLAAGAAGREVLAVDPAASVVRFHVEHRLHKVDGSSRSVEGKAVIEPDGRVLAMVRIPIASFDSGDANRDSNLRETLDEPGHPFVVFKGVCSVALPAPIGAPFTATLRGELDFHGVKHPIEIPVSVQLDGDGSATIRGTARISLEEYHVERPSFLLVKLDDACTVTFELILRRSP